MPRPNIVRFKAHYFPAILPNEQICLLAENEQALLNGKIYRLIAPLIAEEKYTTDQIAEKLKRKAPLSEIFYALERLKQKGFIVEQKQTASKELAAMCALLNTPTETAQTELQHKKIFVQSLCTLSSKPLTALLTSSQIRVTNRSALADLVIVIAEDVRDPRLKAINARHLKSKTPWLLLTPFSSTPSIGPLFIPPETACWDCLQFRIEQNRVEESHLMHQIGVKKPLPVPKATLPAHIHLSYSHAVIEVLKWIIKREASSLIGKIATCDTLSLKLETHHLIKRHRCPSCDKTSSSHSSAIELAHLHQRWVNDDNGYHTALPEETLHKYAHLISPVTGIVKELTPLNKKYGSSFHVYVGGNNFALSNKQRGILSPGLRSNSSGKGRSDLQAKVSCLCESIERYSGIFHGYEPQHQASYRELASQAIHPKHLVHFSDTQYANRASNKKPAEKFHFVPEPFQENKKIPWTQAWSLIHKKSLYVPAAFCFYAFPQASKEQFFFADSNGCASGNCYEEAILQGFFELVERDAVAIWWYNRLQRPKVDIESFQDPYLKALISDHHALKRTVWALDLTTDLKIPTFAACSQLKQGPQQNILMGFGTHLNPSIAISRALTEMNQMIELNEAHSSAPDETPFSRWLREATVENQPYLQPHRALVPTTQYTYRYRSSWTLSEQLAHCQQIVERAGMDMLVVDQTRPDIGLCVVKVIVPGLRHFWPRFAPGRLYDVPVKQGWLERPLKEHELNPIPLFL